MRLVKFSYKKKEGWAVLENDNLTILKHPPFGKIVYTCDRISLKKVRLLPPCQATKIVLVGLNYKDHAKELNMKIPQEPIIFLKPPSSLIGHKQTILLPQQAKRVDYEGELAFVIKRKCKNISPQQASRYILGFTCLNDITARDLQKKDIQWSRAKSFDTFCPIGPWIETEIDPHNLTVKTYVNGVLKQKSSTKNLIFSIYHLLSFISKIMTLFPGDVISSGTPSGVGCLKEKDIVTVDIEGIGKLVNYVRKRQF